MVGFIAPSYPWPSITHALHVLSGNLKEHFKDRVKVFTYDMYADHGLSIDSVVTSIIQNKTRLLGLSLPAGTLYQAKELFDKINERIPPGQRPLIVLGNAIPIVTKSFSGSGFRFLSISHFFLTIYSLF